MKKILLSFLRCFTLLFFPCLLSQTYAVLNAENLRSNIVSSEMISTDPVSIEPVSTDPVSIEPVSTDPVCTENFHVVEPDFRFKIGGRSVLDMGSLGTDNSAMKFQTKISDFRLHGLICYGSFKLFAELSFANDIISYKDIYLRYSFPNKHGKEIFSLGYLKEPVNMGYTSSSLNYHFVSRANSVSSLTEHRALGLLYVSNHANYYLSQGVFYSHQIERQKTGAPSLDFSGRWLYKQELESHSMLQFGGAMSFSKLFEDSDAPNFKLGTKINNNFGYNLNTYVPDVENTFHISVEALYMNAHYFARGEYIFKNVKRNKEANRVIDTSVSPSSRVHYHGGYLEVGALLGGHYIYDSSHASVGNMTTKSVEFVARFNYTNLYDASLYSTNDAYGFLEPRTDGGSLHSYTCGVNYRYSQAMSFYFNYTYNALHHASYLGYDASNYILARCILVF